VIESLTATSDR